MKMQNYHHHQHSQQLLNCLCELQANSWLCDLAVVVSDKEFYVHRIVMAAVSPYFRSLVAYDTYTPSQDQQYVSTQAKIELSLDCVTSAGFEAVVNFIYKGQVWLNDDNVEEIVKAANALMVLDLEKLCWDFIGKGLTLDNCISIMILADRLGCSSVKMVAMETVKENFYKVCKGQDFLQQPPDVVADILHLKGLKLGENTLEWCMHFGHAKTTILQEVINWVFHDPRTRKQYLQELLKVVKWSNYSVERLQDFLDNNEHVVGDGGLRYTLQMAHRLSQNRSSKEEKFIDVLVCSGGEDKGDDYFLPEAKEDVVCVPLISNSKFDFLHLPVMNAFRTDHAILAVGDYLYVTGGKNEELDSITSVERYDQNVGEWTMLAPMPFPRSSHQMVARGGTIYVVGGQKVWWDDAVESFEINSKDIFAYDIQSNSWKVLACKMSKPRINFGCIVHKTNLYIIGGTEVDEGPLNQERMIHQPDKTISSVEMIDTLTETMHTKANLLSSVANEDSLPGIVMGDLIYVSAGLHRTNPSALRPPQLYDTRTDSWTTLPMPTYKGEELETPTDITFKALHGFWHISNKYYMVHTNLGILETDDLFTGKWEDLAAYLSLPRHDDLWPFHYYSLKAFRFAHYRLKIKAVDSCKELEKHRFKEPKNKTVDEFFSSSKK